MIVTSLRNLLLVMALFSVGGLAWAQAPEVDKTGKPEVSTTDKAEVDKNGKIEAGLHEQTIDGIGKPLADKIDKIDASLKAQAHTVEQITAQLDAGGVPDATLEAQLKILLAYPDEIQNGAELLKAAVYEPKERLGDLGPPPAKGEPPESAEIAKLRKILTDEVARLTGLSEGVDLLQAAVDRLTGRIRSIQGDRFFSRITERSASLFSATLWTEAAADIPPALDGLADRAVRWWQDQRESGKLAASLSLLVAALAGAIALLTFPRWPVWRRFEAALDDDPSPSARDKRRRVAERSLSRGLMAASAGALLYGAAVDAELIDQGTKDFALRIWIGAAALVLVWNYAQSLFSPKRPEWRCMQVGSRAAGPLRTLFAAVFGLYVVDRVLAAGFELSGAGFELTMALAALASSLFAVLLWLALSPKFWHTDGSPATPVALPETSSDAAPPAADAAAGHTKAGQVWPYDVLRRAARLLAIFILVSISLGEIRLANFVFHRLELLAFFLILAWSVRVLARWGLLGLSRLLVAKASTADAPRDEEGSEREIGFWLKLALDLNLLALSIPVFLLIVGFGWLDLHNLFGLFGSDIRIGAVSFSFTDILIGVLVFLLVSVGTRWATSVVDKKLLQRTRLDTGARDSIMTLVNYAGVVAAILIALPIVGVDLTKLAIVAGALSVGIGFGLKGIVNDFVSGLILLFERPIKMGDWIVVPSGEGYVKRIGARATLIQNFDQSSVFVPNSELISSAVSNWFYRNRLGRLRVAVRVSYGSDPERVRDILLACARQHPSISRSPAAKVLWMDFAESSLDFELRAFVRDYDDAITIRSDLRFAIFKAFKDAGVKIPFPQRDLHIRPQDTHLGGSSARGEDAEAGESGGAG